MVGSYLKSALQNVVKNKLFSFINIIGLGIGFASFVLIALFVLDELSYDRGFANGERIFRISRDVRFSDGSPDFYLAANGPLEAAFLKQDFPQVEQAARLRVWAPRVSQEDIFSSEQAAFADQEFLSIFDFEWREGSSAGALNAPFKVVLTESLARKYFNGQPALGRTLMLDGEYPVEVSGVIADLPHNTHLDLSMLVSMPTAASVLRRNVLENPSLSVYHTYVLLREGADIADLEAGFQGFISRHYGTEAANFWALSAMPLFEIHLRPGRDGDIKPSGSMVVIYAFSLIATFILLVACFNFMNLASAQATQRAKEVGVRKAIGAERQHVMAQFLVESLLMSLLAMFVAIALVELVLPSFNGFLGKNIIFDYAGSWLLPLLLMTMVIGTMSGSYPAFYLSSFNPVKVLKDKQVAGGDALVLRNVLVILQFTVAIVLLISTMTVYFQVRFAQSLELGFDKDRIVVLNSVGREGLGRQWDALKVRLLSNPSILSVTASNTVPGSRINSNYFIRAEGIDDRRTMPVVLVDYGFFDTYGISFLSGRPSPPERNRANDQTTEEGTSQQETAYVLNELAVRQLGWSPEEAVGKPFEVTCCGFGRGTIVGVVRNVYFESVQVPLSPMVYLVPPEPGAVINEETRLGLKQASLRISRQSVPQTLEFIRDIWSTFFPETPADLRFLQEDFDSLYLSEERQNQMLLSFTALSIFIACLGLYGLASFNAQRRTREIGIRKVMGGSVWSIVLLLTNDFSKLVLLANVIAWPVAYFAMSRWLENFAYRIDLTPMIFIGSGMTALCIAWVTVGGTAAKAASAKPVLALRYE